MGPEGIGTDVPVVQVMYIDGWRLAEDAEMVVHLQADVTRGLKLRSIRVLAWDERE